MDATLAFIPVLVVGTLLYGVRWRRAPDAHVWHAMSFAGGVVAVLASTQGPLYQLAEHRLAVAHVIVLILLIHAAPFFFLRAITPEVLGPLALGTSRALARLPKAFPLLLMAAVAYLWHVPGPFDAAARSSVVGAGQHASFVLVGMLAWTPISGHANLRPALRGAGAFLYMLADEVALGLLGIVLTWAPEPLYQVYVDAPRSWGLSVASDQAVAGAVLTVVEEAPMAVALGVVFIRMLQRDEAELLEQERRRDAASGERNTVS